MTIVARQLPLPLPGSASYAAAEIVPDAGNLEALAWLDEPARWPLGRLALWGPQGAGKTHLLRATAAQQGWHLLSGLLLRPTDSTHPDLVNLGAGLALDDADEAPETVLFHTINWAAERGARLLLAARLPPARWRTSLPDLASRLRATAAVEIGPPGEALLAALLAKQFADRQLRVEPALQTWLLARLPREAAAIAEAAERLDHAALVEGGAVSRALARRALGPLLDAATPEDGWEDMAEPGQASLLDGLIASAGASAPGAKPALVRAPERSEDDASVASASGISTSTPTLG